MCGRYYIEIDTSELEDICRQVEQNAVSEAEQLTFNMKSGEVFPTNIVPIRVGDGVYKPMKWGFTAYDGKLLINARSETAIEKPTFKKSMLERRCLIPASGYYEWQKQRTSKQKYSFYLPDKKLVYMAGCYRQEEENPVSSFVILTKAASPSLKEIHNRMPVIIPENRIHSWLYDSPDVMNESLNDLLFEPAV